MDVGAALFSDGFRTNLKIIFRCFLVIEQFKLFCGGVLCRKDYRSFLVDPLSDNEKSRRHKKQKARKENNTK
jgi:hypothetical protein